MIRLYAIAAAVGILALVGGTYAYTALRADAACRGASIAGGSAAIGGPFDLVDGTGTPRTADDVIDGPTLVYFGYTFCPDVCPFDVARNALAVDLLAESGYDVTPVFITVDPLRDDAGAVGDFAANMHPKMIGLTGTEAQVEAAKRAYKVYAAAQDTSDPYYLVDHSTFTYLMFPDTGLATYFGRETSPEEMALQTACLIDAT